VTGAEFRALALSLPGTGEVPHFERTAFRVRRHYATLPPDGTSANLLLTPEEQAHYADLSDAVRPVPNRWGDRGWTTVDLGAAETDLVRAMLRAAWLHGGGRE